jgi:phosphoribosylamine---glycine ligase
MNVLVIGSGGREHALAWAIAASPLVDQVFCAPGNAGIAEDAECVPVAASDTAGLIAFCKKATIDFVVVGPEAPLVAGLVDALEAEGIATFGPSKAAAALEGSKGFLKDLCAREGIPTAAYRRFRDAGAAKAYIAEQGAPVVVKADGLAGGKGVTVAATLAEAHAAVDAALGEGRFGAAGAEIVVEEYLQGEEASFFALVDGVNALPLAAAQDHKRVGDGDTGPNTGGMGAFSPTPLVTPALEGAVMERMILPTVRAMARAGRPFKGVLYAGLMLTEAGPKLLEYNVRFGDPECQVLMRRLMSDIMPALIATRDGILKEVDLRWYDEAALCVSRRPATRQRDRQPRCGGERLRGEDLSRRHETRRGAAAGGWRTGARRDSARRRSCDGARAGVWRGRQDRVAGRLLPARYRPAPPRLKPIAGETPAIRKITIGACLRLTMLSGSMGKLRW